MSTSNVYIEHLSESDMQQTVDLLAKAMSTNPLHISIFGEGGEKALAKQKRMFEMVLNNSHTLSFTAKIEGQVVGSMSYTNHPFCRLSVSEVLKLFPKSLHVFGKNIITVAKWRYNWEKHDPTVPHVHFGPLAVHPSFQGKGIGKMLLEYFCRYLDQSNQIGYLETDKIENVTLYKKFGFEVTKTDYLFNTKNWFMVRPPSTLSRSYQTSASSLLYIKMR